MSRPLRINYTGAFYHVYHRGIERRKIYQNKADYALFLKILSETHRQFKIIIHAYCLMNNHYHLFIETPEGNLSRAMRHLNGVYTQKFNKKYSRVGSLFQGRYRAKLVDQESYGLQLARYIHLNPVKAKMVKTPDAYVYSSYPLYLGRAEGVEGVEMQWLLGQLGNRISTARREFEKYTMSAVDANWKPSDHVQGRVVLGEASFFKKICKKYIKQAEDPEISELREIKKTLDGEKIEKMIESANMAEREKRKCLVYLLKRHTPLTLNEIAVRVDGNVGYSGISKLVSRFEVELKNNSKLSAIVRELEEKMSKVKT